MVAVAALDRHSGCAGCRACEYLANTQTDSTKSSSMPGGSTNYDCALTDSRIVEEGEAAETGSPLQIWERGIAEAILDQQLPLACNSATADRAGPIPTKEVMYPCGGPLDVDDIEWEFMSGGPLGAGDIEWESMGGGLQEWEHS